MATNQIQSNTGYPSYDSVATLKTINLNSGEVAKTDSYYAITSTTRAKGSGTYNILTSAEYTTLTGGSPDGYIDFSLNNGNVAVLVKSNPIDPYQAGAKGDGTTSDNGPFTSIEALSDIWVFLSEGTFKLTGLSLTKTYYGPGSIVLDSKTIPTKRVSVQGPRDIIQYKDATSVYIRSTRFDMGGFRFFGRYKQDEALTFPSNGQPLSCSTSSDLAFGMSSVVLENWYAVFACANNEDQYVTLKIVPFLRADSVATSTITLRKAGENVHSSSPQTYTWANDALNNLECLVISETLDGRTNAFSGRVATITDSTTTTITLDTIGTVAANDWLLPAPNGFDNYRYCGSFYMDAAEVRNIADSGTLVVSKGIYDFSGTNTGSVASPEKRSISGYISPLATAVSLYSTFNLATTSTGQYVEYYAIDGSAHTIYSVDIQKVATVGHSCASAGFQIPFSFGQQYYYSNAGAFTASRTNGQQNITGWIEV